MFDRDLDQQDREEQARECATLLATKLAACTTPPGSVNDYVTSFVGSTYNRVVYGFPPSGHMDFFNSSFTSAAYHFVSNQDSVSATTVFFESARDQCLHGGGADIDQPTPYPISNEIYCLWAAGRLAGGMNTSLNSTLDGLGLGWIISTDFGTLLGPWGNSFYTGLTNLTACRAWYSMWNANQC